MAARAHLSAHRDALRVLSDLVYDKKDDLSNKEYLDASNALKKLNESAGAMASSSRADNDASVRANGRPSRHRNPDTNEEQWLPDVEEMTDLQRFVHAIENGERPIGDLVGVLRGEDEPPAETILVAVGAIQELLIGRSELVTRRQTALGQAGVMDAMAALLARMDPSEETFLQVRILTALSVLVRQHETNKELLGASGAFRAITMLMRNGPGRAEKEAIRVLSDAGFQHTANQRAMLETNTIEAIVHLISQVRPIDRTEPVIKLLHQLLCPTPCAGRVVHLRQQAIDQGAIALLLGKIYGGGATYTAIETLYQLFDENDEVKDRVASEGGIERLAAVLTNECSTLEDKGMSAKALGEMGANSFAHRRTIAALGVIATLKELETEPSGRRRHNFTFAIKRLDEEGDGSAARYARQAREQQEAEQEREAKKANREAEKAKRAKLGAELRKEIEERIKPTPAQRARPSQSQIGKHIAKKRVRK